MANPNKTVARWRRANPFPPREHRPVTDPFMLFIFACAKEGRVFKDESEAREAFAHETKIETADSVYHKHSGEDWVVARVTETHVYPAGWPPCRAKIEDCTLLKKATEKQREEMIAWLGNLPPDDDHSLLHSLQHSERIGHDSEP